MQQPKAIGIAGPARVGKDTAALWFVAHGYVKLSFAEPLKRGLAAMLGLTLDHLEGDLKECVLEPYGRSPRYMMQTIGTEWGRELINEDVWLMRASEIVAELKAETDCIGPVISDVRFENEAKWVRDQGGVVVHLSGRLDLPDVEAHESEAGVEWQAGDATVVNDGSIAELYERLAIVIEGSPHGRDNLP
jgi:hypothetical protein